VSIVPGEKGVIWNGSASQAAAAAFSGDSIKLLNRSYGSTLVKIGAHYVPRRSLILALSESVLFLMALVLATVLRFLDLSVARDYFSHPQNWLRFASVTLICQLALYYNELYEVRVASSRGAKLARAFAAMGIALMALSLLYYLVPAIRMERGIAILAAVLSITFLVAWRLTLEKTRVFSRPVERILVMGTGQHGISLAGEILRRPELQYKVVGFLDERGSAMSKTIVTPGIIGAVSEVEEIAARESVDRVVISLAERRGVMPIRQLASLRLQGLPIEEAQSVYERLTGRLTLEQLQPSWLVLSEGFRKSRFALAAKRATDILVSGLLILLTLPLMLVVALAIMLESGRPVLFKQERVGLGGRRFKIWKFRSMTVGSDKDAPTWTAEGDSRITRVGAFIRKYRLDELPQLVNILRGEMSLVGPRPEVPYFCDLLEREIPFFNLRHSVRPGLTGWAQVKYQYGASLEQAKTKFEFDLFYIKHLSVLFDLTIILETAKVVLIGKGAK
jgi:sugar transferase (PEP-CTERM system associated)